MRAQVEGLNDRIRELVFSTGKTMADISRDMGLSRNVLSQWIDEGVNPSVPAIAQICKYFNVSADWLLGLSDKKKPW